MNEIRSNQFTHERLEAYRVALEFLGLAQAVLDEMPRAGSTLREQLASAGRELLLREVRLLSGLSRSALRREA